MDVVPTELDAMVPANPVYRIGNLSATLVRQRDTLQECLRSKRKAIGNRDTRRKPTKGIAISSQRRAYQVRCLVRRRILGKLELKIAAILIPDFVADGIRNHRIQLRNAKRIAHIVVSKAMRTVEDRCSRLNAGGRDPSKPIYLKRSMVLSIDLPVQLREENCLIARTWHAAKQCIQI